MSVSFRPTSLLLPSALSTISRFMSRMPASRVKFPLASPPRHSRCEGSQGQSSTYSLTNSLIHCFNFLTLTLTLTPTLTPLIYVRWEANSCGYHGDDGLLYRGHGKGEAFGPTYTSGDVVGAGINYAAQEFFFTYTTYSHHSSSTFFFQSKTTIDISLFPFFLWQ